MHLVPKTNTTSDKFAALWDEMKADMAKRRNHESVEDMKRDGQVLDNMEKINDMLSQRDAIEPVYLYWRLTIITLQDTLGDIAKKQATNNFTIKPFPDLDVAAQSIADGPFSDIGIHLTVSFPL